MSFGLGIIGAGTIGNIHADKAAQAGLRIAGAYDTHPDKTARLVDGHAGAVAANSLEELLAVDDMPAVVVGVPNDSHKETAIAAMRAGKDLLLEKPMAMTAAECDEIMAVQRETERMIQLGFLYRYTPITRTLKNFIDHDRLGRVYHVKASLSRRRGIPGLGGWFTTKARSGGGPLIDIGVHLLDLVLYLTGYPKASRASAACYSTFGLPMESYRYVDMWAGPPQFEGTFDVEDAAHALIRFENAMTLDLNVAWAGNVPDGTLRDGVTLFGDRGGCTFELLGKQLTIATEDDEHLIDINPAIPQDDPMTFAWAGQYQQFVQAVEKRIAPHASSANGRAIQAILDALYRSSAAGQEVEVDSISYDRA